MRPDLQQLALGRLVYEAPMTSIDDVRFERIIRGFAGHYEITSHNGSVFTFARGEGYHRFERFDAFGYVDGGMVERISALGSNESEFEGAVVMMPPRFSALRFTLNMRVIVAFWAFTLFCGWALLRGEIFFWGIGFLGVYAVHIALVAASLRRKLALWLARESWN